ncbi:MAG: B12-binding domain-containing radical SAM protein [Candidatus Omnitrophica bacterium]|nr:B12-binding domain-containing radical SAM protein [Candidatus Omnitrophota bacterium]
MKVLLIKSVTKHFPLGLMYLASELEGQGFEVSILDYFIGRYNPDSFKERLPQIKPDLVGINCFSFEAKPAFFIARLVRQIYPKVHITMGGPHPTGLPEYTLKSDLVDSVVIGEGEKTLVELAQAVNKKQALSGIKGLAFKERGRVVFNGYREHIKEVDNILYPAYHLIDLDKYFEFPDPHGMATRHPRFMSIFTSRGCPFSCTYCHNTFGKSFRARSPENVLGEIELLYHKFGIREFHIEDDAFNVDLDRAEKILDMIIERKLKISMQFPNGIRADRLNDRFVRKLKKAGTFMVAIGVESASKDILKQIRKNLDLNKILPAIKILAKNNILVWGYFMIGFLNEKRSQIQETIDFASKTKLHFASFSIVVPYPGTEIFEEVRSRIDLDKYFSERLTYSLPQLQLSEVPLNEIGEIKRVALKKFYNPIRILRIVGMVSSFKEIKFYWGKFIKNVLKPRFGEAQKRIN